MTARLPGSEILRQHSLQVVEALAPAVLVIPHGLLVPQVAVGEADRRHAAGLLEVDLDQLALVVAVPVPGVRQPAGWVDFRECPPPPYSASLWGSRITTRTAPPTRRSTEASVVSQSCAACHQRRSTSSLVHASNTAWAGASKVRSICSVVLSLTYGALGGVARGALSTRAPPAAQSRRRPAPAPAPPVARPRRERSSAFARHVAAQRRLAVVVVVA